MLGKASELRSELIDARELDGWLVNSPNVDVIDIKFSMIYTTHNGVMPQALIIYKEGESK
jgi:hypothetical protein